MREGVAPAKGLRQEGIWHVVGTERGLGKRADSAGEAWETERSERCQGARSHHPFRLR